MPLLTPEMKKALRRVQADKFLTKKQLAEYIGVSESTAIYLTKDNEPQNVKNKVFNAVVSAIAENCQSMNKLDTAIKQSKQWKKGSRGIETRVNIGILSFEMTKPIKGSTGGRPTN